MAKTVKMEFKNTFDGFMEVENGRVELSAKAMSPYNLLFGALGGCLYHTFLDIVVKKRLTFNGAKMEIGGKKRETPPTTLETVHIKFIINGAENEKQFEKSVELAAKYCSIHETISKVAEITMEVIFE